MWTYRLYFLCFLHSLVTVTKTLEWNSCLSLKEEGRQRPSASEKTVQLAFSNMNCAGCFQWVVLDPNWKRLHQFVNDIIFWKWSQRIENQYVWEKYIYRYIHCKTYEYKFAECIFDSMNRHGIRYMEFSVWYIYRLILWVELMMNDDSLLFGLYSSCFGSCFDYRKIVENTLVENYFGWSRQIQRLLAIYIVIWICNQCEYIEPIESPEKCICGHDLPSIDFPKRHPQPEQNKLIHHNSLDSTWWNQEK